MLLLLKFIHYLGFSIGLGCGLSAIVCGLMLKAEPAVAAPIVKRLGRLSFSGLVLLWITGPWLYSSLYPAGAGVTFILKMIVVVALTLAALTLQYLILKGPTAASPTTRLRVSLFANGCSALAILLALIAFG